MKIKSATKTELAAQYGVCLSTFNKWLHQIEDLNLVSTSRILSPKQVASIYAHLGLPEIEVKNSN